MKIECCHHCEERHEKCHAHCEKYLTLKILKIVADAPAEKRRRTAEGLNAQRDRTLDKIMHDKHLRRRR
jgi:hypothetical protein